MSKKAKKKTGGSNSPNLFIIGVPLAIAAIFSFSFISMNPNETNVAVSKTKNKPSSQPKQTSLPPIDISAAKVQTLTPLDETTATESQPTAPSGGGGVAATSQNPQPSSDKNVAATAATAKEVQSAAQTKNLYNIKISVPKTPPVKLPSTSLSR